MAIFHSFLLVYQRETLVTWPSKKGSPWYQAALHIGGGAKKVIISAPPKDFSDFSEADFWGKILGNQHFTIFSMRKW
jgi:hypothetical protein